MTAAAGGQAVVVAEEDGEKVDQREEAGQQLDEGDGRQSSQVCRDGEAGPGRPEGAWRVVQAGGPQVHCAAL